MAARHHLRGKRINQQKKMISSKEQAEKPLEDIDLLYLSTEWHQKAINLIIKISEILCQDSDDIGDDQNCKMKIHLKDEAPAQRSYYSIPKPLHQEVKHYVKELLNKG